MFIVKLKILVLAAVFCAGSAGLSSGYELWEGFDGPFIWSVATWDNAGVSVVPSDEHTTVGETALKFSFERASDSRKAICMLEKVMDWSEIEGMKLDIYNDTGRYVSLAISITTGDEWEWYESRGIRLDRGWNKDVTFDLTDNSYKAERSNWRHRLNIENLDSVLRVSYLFWGAEGDIYMDNIRLKGYKKADTVQIGEIRMLDCFDYEHTEWLLADWSARAESLELCQDFVSEGSQSLKLTAKNATEEDKATFCIEQEMDWSGASVLYMDVYSPHHVPVKINAAISTGEDWIWYESPDITIGQGWNKDVAIDLNADNFKSEATNWRYAASLEGKEEVQMLSINLMGPPPEGLTGSVYIDNIRLGIE